MGFVRRRWKLLVAGLVVAVAAGVVGIPYVYIHFINKPEPKLTFANRDKELAKGGTVASSALSTDGTWIVGAPSTAGYRVKETLNGQSTEGVGRTDKIDGSFVLAGSTVQSGEFNVDVSTLASDQGRRDNQVRGRLLSTDEFPVSTFTLGAPVALEALPDDGVSVTTKATGTLSLRGVEKDVTLDIEARRAGTNIELLASTTLVFADFEIPDPSVAPFVTTEQSGLLEVSLTLTKAA